MKEMSEYLAGYTYVWNGKVWNTYVSHYTPLLCATEKELNFSVTGAVKPDRIFLKTNK